MIQREKEDVRSGSCHKANSKLLWRLNSWWYGWWHGMNPCEGGTVGVPPWCSCDYGNHDLKVILEITVIFNFHRHLKRCTATPQDRHPSNIYSMFLLFFDLVLLCLQQHKAQTRNLTRYSTVPKKQVTTLAFTRKCLALNNNSIKLRLNEMNIEQ